MGSVSTSTLWWREGRDWLRPTSSLRSTSTSTVWDLPVGANRGAASPPSRQPWRSSPLRPPPAPTSCRFKELPGWERERERGRGNRVENWFYWDYQQLTQPIMAADQCKDKFFLLNLLNRKHSTDWSDLKKINTKWRQGRDPSDHVTGCPRNISEKTLLYRPLRIYKQYIHISLFYRKCVLIRFVLNNTPDSHLHYLPDYNSRNENVMKCFLPVILIIQI